MTAYARTLLNRPHHEKREGTDAEILATLGSLNARVVMSFDLLNETARQLASRAEMQNKDDLFIVVSDKDSPHEAMALCRMTLSGHLQPSESFRAAGLVDNFKVEVNQTEPCFLTIAPFEFADEAKAHRAQGLLWQSIARYCALNDVDYVVGSLAFNSRYPAAHALELSYLYHFCRSQSGLRAKAENGVTMDIMPEEAIKPDEAFSSLPPMLRYCLRLGAKVGDNAIVDRLKNQTRIFLLFPARAISA